jgi:hypothetical protein
MADGIAGAAMVLNGRPREGIALLEQATEEGGGSVGMLEWFSLPLLANAYRDCGDLAQSLALATRGVALAEAAGAAIAELSGQLALATAAGASGDTARADRALARAAALIDLSGAEAFRPRLHFAAALARRGAGDERGFAEETERGRALCVALGMDELADLAARELAGGEGRE